jgi:zinc transporter 2
MLQRYKPELIDAAAKGDIKKLWAIFFVCCVFIVAEVVGGLIAGSLAILSDAVHLASDLIGFVFSIVAINLSMMDATVVYTYGYARAQILGALISTLLIIVLSIWLAYEAIDRLVVGVQPIQCWFMFGTAVFGLCCNLTMFKVLHSHGPPHDHDHGHGHSHDHGDAHDHGTGPEKEHKHKNAEKVFALKTKQIRIKQMNMHMLKMTTIMAPRSLPVNFPPKIFLAPKVQSANIGAAAAHIMADIIQSVGVVLASIIIMIWPSAVWVDPTCTLIFAIGSTYTTFGTITSCLRVLMEGVPKTIDYHKIKKGISEVRSVRAITDLHIWSVVQGKPCATCHVLCKDKDLIMVTLAHVTDVFRKNRVFHSTVQIELVDDAAFHEKYCKQDIHKEHEQENC